MKKLIFFVVLLALAAGGYYYYNSFKSGPNYALLQAAAATRTHDLAAFERYVDVDALTSHLVDDVANQGSILTSLVPGGSLAVNGALRFLKPQLAKAAHKEVQRYIETGSLAAATSAAPKRLVNLSLTSLAGRVVGADSQFKGIKYTTEKGDEALVGLEFTQPKYDTTMVLEVKLLKQADDHWQVKEITNTANLLRGVAHLEKNRLVGSH
ncbi:hypothetical protein FNT36_07160 [Hymenobacter setariae]|uniref:DUF2939 domain-containing protein n=1 Tax=Hymenobacter setariae TaxID=2594794 RepID=A0A558BXL1_9BACT|nr:hypothetical protein [Hymenobacter setariae]TVT41232.1 hypothetical protein FNT36_07160 [Hymenobacter setariae]